MADPYPGLMDDISNFSILDPIPPLAPRSFAPGGMDPGAGFVPAPPMPSVAPPVVAPPQMPVPAAASAGFPTSAQAAMGAGQSIIESTKAPPPLPSEEALQAALARGAITEGQASKIRAGRTGLKSFEEVPPEQYPFSRAEEDAAATAQPAAADPGDFIRNEAAPAAKLAAPISAAPRVGGGAIAAAADRARAGSEERQEEIGKRREEIRGAREFIVGGEEAAIETEAEGMAKRAEIMREQAAVELKERQRAENAQQAFEGRMAAQRDRITEAKEDAKYSRISRDERRRLQDIIDPNSEFSREEKAEAQNQLSAAQKLDEGLSGGETFVAAIAAALGAYGAGLTGGENSALKAVNAGIARRIKSQRAQLAKRKGEARGEVNELGLLMDDFKSDEGAEHALYIKDLSRFKTDLEATALDTGSQALRDRAMGEVAKVDMEIAGREDALMKLEQADAQKSEQVDLQAAQVRTQIGMQREQLAAKSAAAGKDLILPGIDGVAVSPKARDEVTKFEGHYKSAQRQLEKMKQLRGEAGFTELFTPFPTKIKGEWDIAYGELLIQLKEQRGMGAALSENEKALLAAGVPEDVGDWNFVMNNLRALSETQTFARDDFIGTRFVGYQPKRVDASPVRQ